MPDVAANADWDASPYLLVVDGTAQTNGGTSAASPLWASLMILINQSRGAGKRIGYVTPLLYQNTGTGGTIGAAGCTDVVSGDNTTDAIGGYSAGPGYDAVSTGVAGRSVAPAASRAWGSAPIDHACQTALQQAEENRCHGRPCITVAGTPTSRPMPGRTGVCYAWVTMSAINGDKARFHRQRKHKLAKRERNRALRKKVATSSPRRRGGRDL